MEKDYELPSDVPFIVYEGAQARQERTVKKLVAVIIVCIALLFATNALWLYAWMQYDYAEGDSVSTTYQQDGKGVNIIGNENEVDHGEESN